MYFFVYCNKVCNLPRVINSIWSDFRICWQFQYSLLFNFIFLFYCHLHFLNDIVLISYPALWSNCRYKYTFRPTDLMYPYFILNVVFRESWEAQTCLSLSGVCLTRRSLAAIINIQSRLINYCHEFIFWT